jgi:hypothetical protein
MPWEIIRAAAATLEAVPTSKPDRKRTSAAVESPLVRSPAWRILRKKSDGATAQGQSRRRSSSSFRRWLSVPPDRNPKRRAMPVNAG